jgi:hypothetical protein
VLDHEGALFAVNDPSLHHFGSHDSLLGV